MNLIKDVQEFIGKIYNLLKNIKEGLRIWKYKKVFMDCS